VRAAAAEDPAALFLDGSPAGTESHARALAAAARIVGEQLGGADGPVAAVTPDVLARLLDVDVAPEAGAGLEATLQLVGDRIVRNSVAVTHPLCAAHLHCPPMVSSLAADAVIAATNQSLDSWDQAPAATHLETRMIDWLGGLYGLGDRADGVFTPGGTQSNLMGLLLARDRAAARAGHSIAQHGVGGAASRLRIVASSTAHFSVRKSARILGLGDRAVVEVTPDDTGRLDPARVDDVMSRLARESLVPMALVATAGTTDLGAIDPLRPLGDIARRHAAWLHVDAAVGGALAVSDREAHRLDGIGAADSITVDFHKLWFQSIACGAFLVRDAAALQPALIHADYLNPEGDDDGGLPNLVDKSLQTTRRFDALKLFVSLRAHGRRALGCAIERTLDLAGEAAGLISEDARLELAGPPSLNTVLFRCRPASDVSPDRLDRINDATRLALLHSGAAVIGRTRVGGRVHLKLTFMNPATRLDDLRGLLRQVTATATAVGAAELAGV
jgi:L-2,4-diaminobutyrate decarboxylase